jgi:calcineurin-like phosphoesterase family protein/2'-5' RNA ligase
MTHYLIEFRFFGKAKHEFKRLIWEIDRRFRLGHARRHRPVPHITLAGPFYTKDEKRLTSDFEELCAKQRIMTFKVKGFETFDENRVVFINVEPDKNLDEFRWELSKKLRDYCNLRPYDYEREFSFHSTIAMKLGRDKFEKIKDYIRKKPEPEFTHYVVRVTLIKNSKILREYDFFLRKLLYRGEAKSRAILYETWERLEQYIKEKGDVKEGILSKTLNKFKKRQIFFISDLHLDHANIIRYCNRPFESVYDMNNFIVNNWNKTVRRNDVVYFLGDMAYGRGSRKISYWLNKLNGNIIFIKGGHDRSKRIKFYDKLILDYAGHRFLLMHDPKEVPQGWKGWVIHGHTHNNKPEYPLVDKKNKTINVSVELLNYEPLSMDGLLKLISS